MCFRSFPDIIEGANKPCPIARNDVDSLFVESHNVGSNFLVELVPVVDSFFNFFTGGFTSSGIVDPADLSCYLRYCNSVSDGGSGTANLFSLASSDEPPESPEPPPVFSDPEWVPESPEPPPVFPDPEWVHGPQDQHFFTSEEIQRNIGTFPTNPEPSGEGLELEVPDSSSEASTVPVESSVSPSGMEMEGSVSPSEIAQLENRESPSEPEHGLGEDFFTNLEASIKKSMEEAAAKRFLSDAQPQALSVDLTEPSKVKHFYHDRLSSLRYPWASKGSPTTTMDVIILENGNPGLPSPTPEKEPLPTLSRAERNALMLRDYHPMGWSRRAVSFDGRMEFVTYLDGECMTPPMDGSPIPKYTEAYGLSVFERRTVLGHTFDFSSIFTATDGNFLGFTKPSSDGIIYPSSILPTSDNFIPTFSGENALFETIHYFNGLDFEADRWGVLNNNYVNINDFSGEKYRLTEGKIEFVRHLRPGASSNAVVDERLCRIPPSIESSYLGPHFGGRDVLDKATGLVNDPPLSLCKQTQTDFSLEESLCDAQKAIQELGESVDEIREYFEWKHRAWETKDTDFF